MRPFNLKIERLEVGTHKSITLSTTFISSSHFLCNFFSIFLKFPHFHSLAALVGLLLKCRHLEALPFFFPSIALSVSFCVYHVYRGFFCVVVSSKYYCLPVGDAVQSARNLYWNTGRSQTTIVVIATAGITSDSKK